MKQKMFILVFLFYWRHEQMLEKINIRNPWFFYNINCILWKKLVAVKNIGFPSLTLGMTLNPNFISQLMMIMLISHDLERLIEICVKDHVSHSTIQLYTDNKVLFDPSPQSTGDRNAVSGLDGLVLCPDLTSHFHCLRQTTSLPETSFSSSAKWNSNRIYIAVLY